jgi:hypothetical protein
VCSSDLDLYGAYLSGADLSGANLYGTNLSGANLLFSQIKKLYWFLPEEGSFIAWKKCKNNIIVKLLIPDDAKRSCTTISRKCRAEFVNVLCIFDCEGNEISEAFSKYNSMKYIKGIIKPDSFDDDFRIDCSHGIHFFLTRQEAEEYE